MMLSYSTRQRTGITLPQIFASHTDITAVATYRDPSRPGNFDFRRTKPHWQQNLPVVAEYLGVPLTSLALPSDWSHGNRQKTTDGQLVHEAIPGYTRADAEPTNSNPVGDALVTNQIGLAILAMGADCPGGVLYDPVQRATAVIHGGWRPLAAGIVEDTINLLHTRYGTNPANLIAYITPGAGIESFQLDQPARQQLEHSAIAGRFERFCSPTNADGRFTFGLNLAFYYELQHWGINPRRIEYNAEDTITTIDPRTGDCKYHSARREGEANRGNMIWGIVMH